MTIDPMLSTHPIDYAIDRSLLTRCLEACHDCEADCTICADACLSEVQVKELTHCIRLNLDCADICDATARLLSRQTGFNTELARRQLEACAIACRICGEECQAHASMHEHCRICSESCRACENACVAVIKAIA